MSWEAGVNFKIPFPYPSAFSRLDSKKGGPKCVLIQFSFLTLFFRTSKNLDNKLGKEAFFKEIGFSSPEFNLGLFCRIADFKLTLEQMSQICPTFKWPPISFTLSRYWISSHKSSVCVLSCCYKIKSWFKRTCVQKNGD